MKQSKGSTIAKALLLGAALMVAGPVAKAQSTPQFEVTVTNITRGQILSPPVVATHMQQTAPLFTVGEPASEELAKVAEDALNADLMAKLSADPTVMDVQMITGAAGPIMPGETASMTLDMLFPYRYVSIVGMLVTTNDAFFGLNGVRGPGVGVGVHYAEAYDAGSEANTESCADIPGPPCGSAEQRVTDGAEGYVYVHAGVHGGGDLDPSVHDWRNPVARITIRRLN